MSNEFLLIIIGVLFVILSYAGSILSKSNKKESSGNKLRIALGIIGVLIIIYVGFSYDSVNSAGQIEKVMAGNKLKVEYPVTQVKVTSPVEGDIVDCRILTMGVYPETHTKDIWVLLKPTDDKYYPQSDHTNTSYKRNGEWQVITRFGGDEGEKFEIIVYETDASASDFFSSTIADWKEKNEYPGLEENELPEGATVIDKINVTMNKNCRGAH